MSDGGRLGLHEPADQRDARLPAGGVRQRPGALAEPDPPGRSRGAALAAYDEHWRTGEPLRAEYRMLAHDGTELWVRDEAFSLPDDPSGRQLSQGLLVDMTDRKRLESKLIHDALHDPLTGLANRVLLRDHLERAARSPGSRARSGRPAVRRPRRFQAGQRLLRPCAGDDVLCRVAERLVDAVRDGDDVGRQSGDEFAVILGQVLDEDEATAAAERILRELRRPIQLGGRSLVVGGSVGIAVGPRTATRPPRICSSRPTRRCTRPRPTAKAPGRSTTRGCRSGPGRSSRPPGNRAPGPVPAAACSNLIEILDVAQIGLVPGGRGGPVRRVHHETPVSGTAAAR